MQGKLPHTRHYIEVGDRLVHYRKMGDGPALIMQHASPLTSQSLLAGASVFSKHFTCILLDNPGYGLSDPLPPSEQANLSAYASALNETISALGVERPVIYGASTGGAITHMFGCLYPDVAGMLMLDTFSHMDTEETIRGYFPDVRPREDGSHFLTYWNKLARLFLHKPWQVGDADKRQLRDLPGPSIIHNMLMQQLSAGPDYRHLYAAAIEHEDEVNIPKLTARATVNVWQAAPSYATVKAYLDGALPSNYIPIKSPATPNGRYSEQLAWLLSQGFDRHAPHKDVSDVLPPTSRQYIETRFGQMHVRRTTQGKPPLLLLHDWGGSAQSFSALIDQLAPHFDLIVPDLLGHADTPASIRQPDTAMADMVSALTELVRTLDLSNCPTLGIGGGALLGAALKNKCPERIRRASYLASAPIRVSETDSLKIISSAPRLSPTPGGIHLISAFDLARLKEVFWQWEHPAKEYALARPNAMQAERMHQITLDMLRSGALWRELPVQAARWLQTDPDFVTSLSEMEVFVPNWQVGGISLEHRMPTILSGKTNSLPDDERSWGEVIIKAFSV